jgi:hypothetical protein
MGGEGVREREREKERETETEMLLAHLDPAMPEAAHEMFSYLSQLTSRFCMRCGEIHSHHLQQKKILLPVKS